MNRKPDSQRHRATAHPAAGGSLRDEPSAILARLKSLYPKSIDLTLDRPRRLLAELDHPEESLPPVVHFAGTNGKGSTLAMVRAGLESAGTQVHAYISPHLTRFNERITLAGKIIEEEELAEVLLECEAVNADQPISLFEITTAAAMLAFSRHRADMLLLEVGLGGRLDATNVVAQPRLTVITPVSMDHEQYLGATLKSIAGEKAGILKPGVPCVVARQQPEALAEINRVAELCGAPLLVQDRDWFVETRDGGLRYRDQDGERELPCPNLFGCHQIDNAGAAVAALRLLGAPDSALSSAVSGAVWPGRMQHLRSGPLIEASRGSEVWLDGGHNPAAGSVLADTLCSMPSKTTRIICGMLNTKDVRGFLRALKRAADRLYGIAIPGEGASLSAQHIAAAAREVGFDAVAAGNAERAVRHITADSPDCRILICGSLYLAGSVLREHG